MNKKLISGVLFSFVLGTAGWAYMAGKKVEREMIRQKGLADKHLALFTMMCDWMRQKQEGKSLGEYLKNQGYQRVAIYGLSFAGERLLDELQDNGFNVPYVIDQKTDPTYYFDIEICRPNEELAEVDAVIVTAITFYDEIKERLKEKLNCPILSLEDIILEM